MKNVITSLLALAAISGAALASDHGGSRHDSGDYFGEYSTQMVSSATDSNALAVVKGSNKGMTTFERMKLNAEENRGGNARESHGARDSETAM